MTWALVTLALVVAAFALGTWLGLDVAKFFDEQESKHRPCQCGHGFAFHSNSRGCNIGRCACCRFLARKVEKPEAVEAQVYETTATMVDGVKVYEVKK